MNVYCFFCWFPLFLSRDTMNSAFCEIRPLGKVVYREGLSSENPQNA